METSILFKIDSQGKTRCWQGKVLENEDGTATICSESGIYKGKITSTPIHVTEGKNVGRKNATTPYEQACKEVNSSMQKKLTEGYTENLDEFVKSGVMLALPADLHLHKMSQLCLAQPKIDGVRLWIKKDDHLVLNTKSGKLHPEFLRETVWASYLESTMVKGEELDGELYIHGVELPDINALVRSYKLTTRELHALCSPVEGGTLIKCTAAQLKSQVFQGEFDTDYVVAHSEKMYKGMFVPIHMSQLRTIGTMDLEYWIFDAPSDNATEDRLAKIECMRDAEAHMIRIVPSTLIDKSKLGEFNDEMVELGFEGTMLRNPSTPYHYDYRSPSLLKYKTFIDEEFLIIDMALDREGNPTLVFLSEAGYEFRCRPTGNKTFRARLLKDKYKVIGLHATIRFQAYFEDTLVPQFGRVIDIRDYE
jgi:DNA ligase-1